MNKNKNQPNLPVQQQELISDTEVAKIQEEASKEKYRIYEVLSVRGDRIYHEVVAECYNYSLSIGRFRTREEAEAKIQELIERDSTNRAKLLELTKDEKTNEPK